jgi:cytoskeletal protein CcmA (bactofilin family)
LSATAKIAAKEIPAMFGKKTNKPQGRIDSLIGAGTSVEGDVTFTGGLRVDGEIKGNVRAADGQPATLVISEHARIEGEISVSHLVINGTVIGPVHSSDFLELQTRARVTGMSSTARSRCISAPWSRAAWCIRVPAKAVELKLAASN